MNGVFLHAAEKSGLSGLQYQDENRRLTLCNVLDMSLLDTPSSFTFSNRSSFDEVSPLTFDMSLAFEDTSSAFEDVSPLTFDVSSAFKDVSPLTFDISLVFEDVSSVFEDMSSAFEDVSQWGCATVVLCTVVLFIYECSERHVFLSMLAQTGYPYLWALRVHLFLFMLSVNIIYIDVDGILDLEAMHLSRTAGHGKRRDLVKVNQN